jgi:hypothetical protein
MIREVLLRIAALFSYCGGPLFIADLLKPRMSAGMAFLITFPPVLLMVLGALLMDDDLRSRWASTAVRAGRLGLYIVLGTHAYALWCFVRGVRMPDQVLHYLGIGIGVVWSIYYLRAARRWVRLTDSSSFDSSSPKPIEPS